jgi:hypothetical protein
MEHIAALLLIIGCSGDLRACEELPAPEPIFETAEECDAELQLARRLYSGERPKVFVQCVGVDPALEEEDAELVWEITPDGRLFAAVGAPQIQVAGTPARRNQE